MNAPPTVSRRLPWYAEGLRFECRGCGDCCSGDPGAVWLNDEEIAQLAQQLQVTEAAFTERYVRQRDGRRALVEQPDGDCIFLDEKRRCQVYAARPVQCRTWPFWPQNVGRQQAWQEVCEVCPGAGEGPVHPLEEIEQRLVAVTLARRAGAG